MPLPVIAGLPWLAGALAALFGSIVAVFAKYLTKRLAIVAAAVAIMVALTATFFTAINGLAAGLVGVMPASMVSLAGHLFPDNLDACISVYLSGVALRWVYEWNVKVVQMKVI